jgi:hypothetical protein
MDKVTPYRTRTGIEIGKYYQRPSNGRNISFDMEIIQMSLLNDMGSIRREKLKSVGFVVSVSAFLFLVIYLTKG